MTDLALVRPEGAIWRVARRPRGGDDEELVFSYIHPEDAALNAGNRFDVPGAGVLYAGTKVESCFAETLARFRPSQRIWNQVRHDPGYMNAGAVSAAWRDDRMLLKMATDPKGLPFVSIDDGETLNGLCQEEPLVRELAAWGLSADLDRSTLYSQDRRITRLLARWVYAQTDDTGHGLYAGLHYLSRLDPQWECWAIFDNRIAIEVQDRIAIVGDNPDLERIATKWKLSLH